MFFFLCTLYKSQYRGKGAIRSLEILCINVAKFMYKFGADIHRVMGDY